MSTTAEYNPVPPDNTRKRIPPLVWLSCVTAATCGLLFGLHAGVISGAIKFIQQQFGFDDGNSLTGWIVGAMLGGAAVGALGASVISNALGRKRSLLLSGALFFVGALWACMASSPLELIGARILLGLAIGVVSFVVPLYLSEVAPQHIRGTVLSSFQLMITIGILLGYLINLVFSDSGNWQWMLGITMIPAVLMIIGVLCLPESPRWHASRGRMSLAETTLKRLNSTAADAEHEISLIRDALNRQQHQRQEKGSRMFFKNVNFRRSVLLGVLIQLMQQLSGINAMIYYSPKIFAMANYDGNAAQLWSTVAVGVVNLLATVVAVAFADRWGRKPILYMGFAIMAVSMAVLSTILHVGASTLLLQVVALASLLTFIVGFAMSIGPLAWALCAEIQPTQGRDFGIGCSTIANWLGNMAVGTLFPMMIAYSGAGTFALLAAANALFLILTIVFVPETKGVQLEEIESNLMKGKPLRQLGR